MAKAQALHFQAACPDCPGARLGVFRELVGATKATCAFDTGSLTAGQRVPSHWSKHYAFGQIRRGVLIRQRADGQGNFTAVDAVGPGGVFPLTEDGLPAERMCEDYAATDLLVCLCPNDAVESVLARSPETAAELMAAHRQALARVEAIAASRGAPTADEKVSALLPTLADTLSPPRRRRRLPAELKHRDMAALIGVRQETFCRVLGRLEDRGAIERDRDGLRIIDRDKLQLTTPQTETG